MPPSSGLDQVIVTDTLDTNNGHGHFCRLTVDGFNKIDSITYIGGEELQVESLWTLVGLSATFLNHLYVRWKSNDIPDIVEFLTDTWATALFHDGFLDMCRELKDDLKEQAEVRSLIDCVLQGDLQSGLSREVLARVQAKLPQSSVTQLQDSLLEYLRDHPNHLKTYFLPEHWTSAA